MNTISEDAKSVQGEKRGGVEDHADQWSHGITLLNNRGRRHKKENLQTPKKTLAPGRLAEEAVKCRASLGYKLRSPTHLKINK